jgi:hypothetical protein
MVAFERNELMKLRYAFSCTLCSCSCLIPTTNKKEWNSIISLNYRISNRNVGFGCFIEKPVSIKYLIERLSAELD